MYSGEYVCDVTLTVYPHRTSLKNMLGHGGNRSYDLWNTSPREGAREEWWACKQGPVFCKTPLFITRPIRASIVKKNQ